MFGLSIRETLKKSILNVCENSKDSYKKYILDNYNDVDSIDEERIIAISKMARRNYFDDVANSLFNSFKVSSPNIYGKIQLILVYPSMCGYDDIDVDDLTAGAVYAICYFALKGKTASPKDCIELNHLQNDIINEALEEIDKELT